MTRIARRIVAPTRATTAFDGRGTARLGGRWTGVGRPAVYAASSTSLALLEVLVRARGPLLPTYVVFPLEFDDALVTDLPESRLPENWWSFPPPPELKGLGDAWLQEGAHPVLRVPSAVIPEEPNYVLNPRHPEFHRVRIGEPRPLDVDSRLRL